MFSILRLRRFSQGVGIVVGFLGATGIGMTHVIFPGLHCYACPLAVTICPIGLLQNLVAYGIVPYFWIGVMVIYGLIAGRGFCGWFCPFGTLNDLLSFRKKQIGKLLAYLKYVVLILTVFAAWYFTDTIFCKVCPVASIEASIPYLFMGVASINRPFIIHMVSLVVVIVGMIVVARFWCRYLCPMGALFSLLNRLSFLHLSFDKNRCDSCGVCSTSCPMGLEPDKEHDGHNCIKCGNCAETCPSGAFNLKFTPGGK